jgi:hypothetical protein
MSSTNKSILTEKEIRRIRSFIYLFAAHSLLSAKNHSICVKKTSLQEAQSTSELVNLFIDNDYEKTTPYQFMKSPDEEANQAIEFYRIYEEFINTRKDDKRAIEEFSEWYVNSPEETDMIRYNYPFIETMVTILLLKETNRINEEEYSDIMGSLKQFEHWFCVFNPLSIKRSFIEIMQKVDEIRKTVVLRTKT